MKKSLKITPVKGRPMLHWVGKKPLGVVKHFPAQLCECVNVDNPPTEPSYKEFAKSDKYKDKHGLSFHYDPYNFDSEPERSLFRQVLSSLNTDPPDDVESFLFTGRLTDPKKTDFHFEYLGEDKRYHLYFPDFVIVKNTGEFYIVEMKSESERGDQTVEAKKKAVEKLIKMQLDKFRYQSVYTSANNIEKGEIQTIIDWVRD